MNELPFTGERFVPGAQGEIWVEHWHRYHFAARWVAGRQVLDVACGEGYGTALLARHAARVTGVDLSPQAIAHAQATYRELRNATFVRASCTALPCADASMDVVVSFETLEHIGEHEAFLDEVRRVLKPGGVLILSCPNKLEYSDRREYANEFHVKELYRDELAALVGARFANVAWYGQRPSFFSVIAPEEPGPAQAQLVETEQSHPAEALAKLSDPLYFVLVASGERANLDALPPVLSVLADRDDWVHRDYEHVMKDVAEYARVRKLLESQVREMSDAHDAIAARLSEEVRLLRTGMALQEAAFNAQRVLMDAQKQAHAAQLAQQQHEILRRGGLRWWLRLPLVRFGLLKE